MGPILSGAYLKLHEIGNIDLDKFYWTQGYNEFMTIGNNDQFVANFPVAISTLAQSVGRTATTEFVDSVVVRVAEACSKKQRTKGRLDSLFFNVWADV
jgi:hypothetical protein